MKINPQYTKILLNDIPYLIPYGQAVADFSKALMLNETADLLWSRICCGAKEDELLNFLSETYDASDNDIPELRQGIMDFLNMLKSYNVIMSDDTKNYSGSCTHFIRIGTLNISLCGADKLYDKYFCAFSCDAPPEKCSQEIQILTYPPRTHKNGNILVRNNEIILSETDDSYIFIFTGSNVYELHSAKDGSLATIYCKENRSDKALYELFHAIRFAFLIAAMANDMYVIHSASILYKGKAWLFSGISGTGKSTHTNLWKERYNTPILNGDLNMIGFDNGDAVVYGLPWCGTSEIYTRKTYPLGGITFLKQSPKNEVIIPSKDKKILYFIQRLISPSWKISHIEDSFKFAKKVADTVPFYRLLCTKSTEAAKIMKQHIDNI